MRLLSAFGIGEKRILEMNQSVPGTVTSVRASMLYVIKKPVRLGINESNTRFSHFIHFTYTVDSVVYQGKRFITPHYRCPQAGETIDIYYDPANPKKYACYAFGPASKPMGW